MGATQMGKYDFASWTLHMSSIIIFATMWGWIFHEWKGSSKKAHLLIGGGVATLVLSTIVIGFGAWLKTEAINNRHATPRLQDEIEAGRRGGI